MTAEQAQEFADRILAAIDKQAGRWRDEWLDADRERVASDLRAIQRAKEGLRHCAKQIENGLWSLHVNLHIHRYTEDRDEAWNNLRRTGELYGVTL